MKKITDLKNIIKADINRFSFSQMTSNANGKTSSSGTMGVYIILLSVLCFVYGCFEFHGSGKADIMMYSSANILVGAGLLGYRKSKDNTTTEPIESEEPVVDPTKVD